jgi:phosphohistidine phosphatase
MTDRMPIRFVFVRHGRYDGSDVPRSERRRKPLVHRGEAQAREAGRWLRERGITPDLVVTTDTRRTVQTADFVLEELGFDDRDRLVTGGGFRSRHGLHGKLREWIGEREDVGVLLFVGHHTSQPSLLKLTGRRDLGIDRSSHACVLVCLRDGDRWTLEAHHPGGGPSPDSTGASRENGDP